METRSLRPQAGDARADAHKDPAPGNPTGRLRPLSKGEQTRDRLVAAARRLLAEEGLGQFTTRNVASLSGVSHGMCHYHFADRTDLIIAVIEDMRADWIFPFESAVDAPGSFAERADRVIGLLAQPEATSMLRLHSALHWFALNDERIREAWQAEYARWTDCFVRLFQVLAEERGGGVDPQTLGEVLAAAADGIAAVQSLGTDLDAELILRTLINGLTFRE